MPTANGRSSNDYDDQSKQRCCDFDYDDDACMRSCVLLGVALERQRVRVARGAIEFERISEWATQLGAAVPTPSAVVVVAVFRSSPRNALSLARSLTVHSITLHSRGGGAFGRGGY